MVLCVDEKPQIQALERSQPVLPMRPGLPQRRTHDYRRHGTTSLFAALDVATGKVLGTCFPRHRAVEFRRFLDHIATAVPEDFDIHLVLDNYGTHKTAMIHEWLAAHPRFHLHFTPTSASWMNQVERLFAAITEQQIRRGTHRSTQELEQAIKSTCASTTRIQSRSSGPRAPTRSSNHSGSTVNVFRPRDTSHLRPGTRPRALCIRPTRAHRHSGTWGSRGASRAQCRVRTQFHESVPECCGGNLSPGRLPLG